MVKTVSLKEAMTSLTLPGLERNLFSSFPWMRVIERAYGTKIYVKYIERQGRIVSYFFYAVVKNFLEWKICVCSYCDYCDGVIEREEDWGEFFASLRKEFPRHRIAIRNLRDPLIRKNPRFHTLSSEKFHILDVRNDLKSIWQSTHDSFQRGVRKAQKNGLTVRSCEKKYLKDFFKMHLQIRKRKYHLFAQPYRLFDIIWQEYMDQGKGVLLGAFDDRGEMIAANVYLVCGNTLYYKFNTSKLSALAGRPNNLLLWEGVRLAKERHLDFLDLGSSGLEQEGLIRFKEHAGAQSMNITHLGFEPPDYQFSRKRILRIFTNACTLPWVPDWVTRIGSNIIYPYLA